MEQRIIRLGDECGQIIEYFKALGIRKLFLVCGSSVSRLGIYSRLCGMLREAGVETVGFSEFTPNPEYEAVVDGVRAFCENGCDGVMAIGGGSAIDVAKCIKLYALLNIEKDLLEQKYEPNNIPFIAVPTTAGSGSEATRFAVIYKGGVKLSVSNEDAIPSCVIQSSDILDALPVYQKKATVMDALCHCMESMWSVNSTDESVEHASRGIGLILKGIDGYLSGDNSENDKMMEASYLAGQAINITQTTAGHAMAYKLTGLYGFAHGHAVALCIDRILPYMVEHIEDADMCLDERGIKHVKDTMLALAHVMGGECIGDVAAIFHRLISELELDTSVKYSGHELEELVASVNIERLSNHPIKLDEKAIGKLYKQIMSEGALE